MDNLELLALKKSFSEQILMMSKTIEALTARLAVLEDVVIDAELARNGELGEKP